MNRKIFVFILLSIIILGITIFYFNKKYNPYLDHIQNQQYKSYYFNNKTTKIHGDFPNSIIKGVEICFISSDFDSCYYINYPKTTNGSFVLKDELFAKHDISFDTIIRKVDTIIITIDQLINNLDSSYSVYNSVFKRDNLKKDADLEIKMVIE